MIRDIKIDGKEIEIRVKFNIDTDEPDTLYWLKDTLLEEFYKTKILNNEQIATILGVSSRTVSTWRHERGLVQPRGGSETWGI